MASLRTMLLATAVLTAAFVFCMVCCDADESCASPAGGFRPCPPPETGSEPPADDKQDMPAAVPLILGAAVIPPRDETDPAELEKDAGMPGWEPETEAVEDIAPAPFIPPEIRRMHSARQFANIVEMELLSDALSASNAGRDDADDDDADDGFVILEEREDEEQPPVMSSEDTPVTPPWSPGRADSQLYKGDTVGPVIRF